MYSRSAHLSSLDQLPTLSLLPTNPVDKKVSFASKPSIFFRTPSTIEVEEIGGLTASPTEVTSFVKRVIKDTRSGLMRSKSRGGLEVVVVGEELAESDD